jgi:hypothetical protein
MIFNFVFFSYARVFNRRVSRAFSFSQDTPNKIKKTISSVFRSPFQSSFSQQSLNDQKASKLTSLASLQLTPTLMETKRKFITLQKSTLPLISPTTKLLAQSHNKPHTMTSTGMNLLSNRTLKNLRSTTTSTIHGIAAAMSKSGHQHQPIKVNKPVMRSASEVEQDERPMKGRFDGVTSVSAYNLNSDEEDDLDNEERDSK